MEQQSKSYTEQSIRFNTQAPKQAWRKPKVTYIALDVATQGPAAS